MTSEQLHGVSQVKMLHLLMLCLKSISSHSESFGKKKFWLKMGEYPNTYPFFTDFSNSKIVLTFLGAKLFFLAKMSQYWSTFFLKIHFIFRYIRRGDQCHPDDDA